MSKKQQPEEAMEPTAVIEGIGAGEERAAAARSMLYQLLAEWVRFPWQDFHAAAVAGELAPAAAECIAALPYALGVSEHLAALASVEPDYDEFQAAYVGLFDVGMGGPPCPLYGGTWGGDRQKAMEEALRFYRFFGLTLSTEERDLPDHLGTELEFLHFLAFKEVEALHAGVDAGSYRRAARDFLLRHPAKWLPRALAKLDKVGAPPFWRGLLSFVAAYCRADASYLESVVGPMKA